MGSTTTERPWEGTRREPDVFDAIRGGTLTDAGRVQEVVSMVQDRDPLRERAEEVTGNLILVHPENPLWIELGKAIAAGDVYRAMSLRNRMLLSHKLTITPRFSPA